MPAHPDVSYYYFGRNLWTQHRGVATAGVIPDYEAGTAKVAFSFCSPIDSFRRFNEPSSVTQRRRRPDPAHPDRFITETVIVPNPAPKPGGVDIVNARLGLSPMGKINEAFITVPLSKTRVYNKSTGAYEEGVSLMHTAIDAFNTYLPVSAKPRIWKLRKMVFGLPIFIGLAHAGTYAEALASTAVLWFRRREPILGFVPISAPGH